MRAISNKSEQFCKYTLSKSEMSANPFLEFETWINRAYSSKMDVPNAMSLVTVSKHGQPSIRTVLLKYYDEEGFIFFTNHKSKKAREIEFNPQVAIKFYWPELEQQLIVQGRAKKISKLASIKYFLSRPKESKIAAWCSDQSKQLSSREELMETFRMMKSKFKSDTIPKPQEWGGYRIIPHLFEFWQGREHRLHDRFQYTLKEQSWVLSRIAP